jgi:hypothetical protein
MSKAKIFFEGCRGKSKSTLHCLSFQKLLYTTCTSSTLALTKQLFFWRAPAFSQLCGSGGKHKFGEQNFGEAVP